MNENERHLYDLVEKQTNDTTKIMVTLARIESKLSCVDELKKKCADMENRIDLIERKPVKWTERIMLIILPLGFSYLFAYLINK